jgi:hypothetical protein
MRILPDVEVRIRREIRDLRAKDPLITVSQLTDKLEKTFNHGFSCKYIAKLADKVTRQALIEADRTQIDERMNVTREKFHLASERFLKIIYWTQEENPGERRPWTSEVIEAAKNLAMLDLALLNAEIANGLYKKPITELAREIHYEPLMHHELRNNELILRDYGQLKYRKIDDPRPEPTLESDEDWQAMNCVLDSGVRILSRSRGQKIRGVKHRSIADR